VATFTWECFLAHHQVDQWLEFAGSLAPGSALEAACAVANEYLQLRTYLVGYRLSLADLACWGQLAGVPSEQSCAAHKTLEGNSIVDYFEGFACA